MLARTTEPDAFGELFDRWYSPAHALVFATLHDHDAASSCAGDAFALCWKNLAKLEEPASFGGWVMRIAQTLGERAAADGAAPADAPLLAGLPAALSALGDRDRTMLELHVRQGFDVATVAAVVGLSQGAAAQRVAEMLERGRPAVDALIAAPPLVSAPPLSKHRAAEELVADRVPMGRSELAAIASVELGANARFEAALDAAIGAARAEGLDESTLDESIAEASSRRRVMAGAVALLLVVGVAVVWLTSDDSTDEVVSGPAPTTTTLTSSSVPRPSTTVATVVLDPLTGEVSTTLLPRSSTTTVRGATTTSGKPRGSTTVISPSGSIASTPTDAPTTEPPSTLPAPTTTTIPLVVNFGLGNAFQSTTYAYPSPTAPSLSWSVSGPGVSSVAVSGPGMATAATTYGSVTLCPGDPQRGCVSAAGAYDYTITVKDASGTVLASRTKTLSIS